MVITINVNFNAAPELVNLVNCLFSTKSLNPTLQGPQTVVPETITAQEVPVQVLPAQPSLALVQPLIQQPVSQPQQPVYQQSVEQQTGAIPDPLATTTLAYTIEQLGLAATQLVDAGRKAEVIALLAEFGVQALTFLPAEMYGAFATRLRAMGARI